MDRKEIVSIFPFMEEVKKEYIDELLQASKIVDFEKNQEMIKDGNKCLAIPFILKGRIRVFKISPEGKEITLYKVNSGQMCVLAAICTLGDANYDVIVQFEEKSQVLLVPRNIFIYLNDNSKAWRQYVNSNTSSLLLSTMQKVGSVAFDDIEERLYQYLRERSADSSDIKTTHEKIAMELGSAREVISRKLKQFENEGLLTLSRGHIKVLYKM
ncbi:MAG: Crp/Fnr family transcriptional regulator [Clostridia bacterium]|nr:Crp/Fnr family transcriptional regulator [Clostridia bacterium]